jgi:hypothetical protein
VARELKQIEERSRAVQDLGQLGEVAARWQREIEELFRKKMVDWPAATVRR